MSFADILKLKKQKEGYTKLNERFRFLTDDKLAKSEIKLKATNLVQGYPLDLENDFVAEFLNFVNFCEPDIIVSNMLQKQIEKKINNKFSKCHYCFSNLFSDICIFLQK